MQQLRVKQAEPRAPQKKVGGCQSHLMIALISEFAQQVRFVGDDPLSQRGSRSR